MTQSFATMRAGTGGTVSSRADDAPRPYWNPYLVGVLLGLVLLATYLVTGRGLGATAGFAAVASFVAGLFSPEHVAANAVHAKYWTAARRSPTGRWCLLGGAFVGALLSGAQGRRIAFTVERGPRIADGQRLALAFAGGFVAAFGAKIAKGCTSGQALTGGRCSTSAASCSCSPCSPRRTVSRTSCARSGCDVPPLVHDGILRRRRARRLQRCSASASASAWNARASAARAS